MEKTYIFTREVKRWGVEAGDYYDPRRHAIVGGTEKLLADGVIEEEVEEEKSETIGRYGQCCICYKPAELQCGHCSTPYCGVHFGTTVMTGNCCRGNEKSYE